MEPLWSLYNQLEKMRIDDLKTEHVRVILLAIPTRQMGHWYACREGDIAWQPISEIPDFYEDVHALKGLSPTGEAVVSESADPLKEAPFKPERRKAATAKAVTKPLKPAAAKAGQNERRPMFEDANTDFNQTGTSINMITKPVKERRSARRYPRILSFVVRHQNEFFESETKDISLGGVSIRKPLPAWVPKTFRAKISNKNQVVRVICMRVTESKFRIVEAENWDIIRGWIAKW